jgi:cell division protein FtsW
MCLLAYGAVMVYSATSATSLLQGAGNGSGYLVKFVLYGAVGLVAMRVLARDGVAKAQRFVAPLLAVSFALVLAVHVPHVGVAVNGARRWIGPSALQFEPSELLKLALVLYAATLLARRPRRVHDLRELCRPLLVVVGGACLLVVTEPDLGTAMTIAFTTAALLVAAGIPGRNLAIVAGTALGLVVLYALARPYARARLTSFVDPWAHASGSGFQAVQGQIAIGSGGLFGVGPGQSVQKIFYLPEAPTDFILAVIAEELGVVGVCAAVPVRADRLCRPARGQVRAQPAQRADRRRRHLADRLPGAAERVRRARPRAADGRAAAVRLLRLQQPDRHAGRDGPVAERGRGRHRAHARRALAGRHSRKGCLPRAGAGRL